jgi:large subunit ribosomal protein L5
MSGRQREDIVDNPLRVVRIEKVTVNIATGKSGEPLEKAKKVLNQLTEKTPATKRAKKAIKDFGVRKGEPIAAVVTLRGKDAGEFLKRALDAVSNKVKESSFDDYGNFSFGIKEHIEIPGTRYVPELGIFGATVHVTLGRPGYRIRSRGIRPAKIGSRHYVSHEDAMRFMQNNFGTNVAS